MSAITVKHTPLHFDWHLPAFLTRLFSAARVQERLYTELKDLPDHLLIDIGIDPRSVPLSLNEAIARPDLAHGGVVTAHGRVAAKS